MTAGTGALSPELRAWIAPGLAGVLTIVDAAGGPRVARIWGARFVGDRDVLEVRVQRACALPLIDALQVPRRGALNLIEVSSYRSRMFKGVCLLVPDILDVPDTDPSVTAIGAAFHQVGLPLDATPRMLAHASEPRAMVMIHLSVESVFDQSPKPGAGARL